MELTNGVVTIRDFREEDIENKVRWINDPQNNQYLHYEIPMEVEKTRRWFHSKDSERRRDCLIVYEGHPVGLIGLLAIDRVSRKAEFYISMGEPAYKRKGIATQAVYLILRYAFEDLSLNKVYLNVDAENTAACHLYEKCGFFCEGVFRQDLYHHGRLIDRKRYAVLSENYKNNESEEMK